MDKIYIAYKQISPIINNNNIFCYYTLKTLSFIHLTD